MTHTWDVVIVGGGLAGLVATNCLAGNGLSILVLEKGAEVGGRARTQRIGHQYLNLGPHALPQKGKAVSILEELDIEISGKPPKLGGQLMKEGLAYAAPFTLSGLATTRLLQARERMEWAKVLLQISSADLGKLSHQTFEQWVRQMTGSAPVQSLLYLLGRLATYCHAPDLASAKVIVSHIKTVLSGVLYLDHGWQSLIDQLHNRAVISGVQVQSQKCVKQMNTEQHGLFKVILSDDEKVWGRNVLWTGAPLELSRVLAEQPANFPVDPLPAFVPVKGASLDVALSRLPNPKQLFSMSLTEPIYFSVHSNYARLSDDVSSAVLHVLRYYHPEEHPDPKRIRTELKQFLEQMQPGWRNYELNSRFIPQIAVNQRLPQIGDEQRLARFKKSIPGLYIAGDWASPDFMLAEGAVTSAKQAAEDIMAKEKRRYHAD